MSSSSCRIGRGSLAAALLVGALGATSASTGAEPTSADKAAAQESFAAGMELREKGDHKAALPKFRTAYERVASPITALELGRAFLLLGKLVEAREKFLEAARMPSKPTESIAAKAARGDAARLAKETEARTPKLKITIDGVDEASVTIDDNPLPSAALGAPYSVNPGSHRIAATSSGAAAVEKVVVIKEGEAQTVVLTLHADKPSEPASRSGTSTLTIVGFTIGGVGLVVGSVATVMWWNAGAPCREAPPNSTTTCHNGTAGSFAVGGFVVGIVGVGIGVYGLLNRPEKTAPAAARVSPWVGWGSAGIEGVF